MTANISKKYNKPFPLSLRVNFPPISSLSVFSHTNHTAAIANTGIKYSKFVQSNDIAILYTRPQLVSKHRRFQLLL